MTDPGTPPVRVALADMLRWAANEAQRLDLWLDAPTRSEALSRDRACAAGVVRLIDLVTSDAKLLARLREVSIERDKREAAEAAAAATEASAAKAGPE